jgi:hypothetical protein
LSAVKIRSGIFLLGKTLNTILYIYVLPCTLLFGRRPAQYILLANIGEALPATQREKRLRLTKVKSLHKERVNFVLGLLSFVEMGEKIGLLCRRLVRRTSLLGPGGSRHQKGTIAKGASHQKYL